MKEFIGYMYTTSRGFAAMRLPDGRSLKFDKGLVLAPEPPLALYLEDISEYTDGDPSHTLTWDELTHEQLAALGIDPND